MKLFFAKLFAKYTYARMYKWILDPKKTQDATLKKLIYIAKNTAFGKDHNFSIIRSYEDFKKNVPICDYENLRPYIERIQKNEKNVLWKGIPLYFAKTSGTTSGVKYIPITKASIKEQINGAKNSILFYLFNSNNVKILNGKMIFLQGSPILKKLKNGIQVGRLSGISAHYVPSYLRKNNMPSWETNCIEDWETKLTKIIEETLQEDMTIISGIPSWLQMYFEKLIEKTGKKTIKEIFPNLSLLMQGGVNYEPYKKKFKTLIGTQIDNIELYPASEGFFAFQDTMDSKNGLLLLLNSGIFYEFIPLEKFSNHTNDDRISIKDVKLGVNYVMIISTNAGLWAYNIGDTIEFTCLKPYRVKVTGRVKHFISSFGEHVIVKEVEQAVQQAIEKDKTVQVNEFTVAPQITPNKGLPHHQWFIEFENEPQDLENFAKQIDENLQEQNIYYKDLISGKVLEQLHITIVPKNGFKQYMKSIGKLGGQNKIPKLSNDRKLADKLSQIIL